MIGFSYPPPYLEFIRLFNQQHFFEAHEVLESLWRQDQTPSRDFYHGLIQVAASFVHHTRGNPEGAARLFESASRYLKPYLPFYLGVDLQELAAATQQALFGRGKFPKLYLKQV